MVNRTDRHVKRPIAPRQNHHRKAFHAMMALSANMPKPPHVYEEGKYYRIKLLRAVKPKDHTKYLRPMQDVIVRGDIANEIAEHIHSAQMVNDHVSV